jgi:ABC-type polysaccharide/polyol phosphate transport system ATPase subunit
MTKVEGISKRFKLYRSPADRLKEIFFRKQYHTDFVALDNISFEIGAGQTLGIIGQNGAGKSTLLKILSGIMIPDTGTIQVDGKVTGLLELGTGFNAEMTGIENIYMNGTLIGMTRDEIGRKKQTIIDFSELGEFIHEPIKTYSSGMTMRLAFAIAIHADPKCFLVDEALAVGDAYFQQKCMRKIQEFRDNGGSIVFVSHDMNAIKTLCNSAIMLDQGKISIYSEPKDVVDFYESLVLQRMHNGKRDMNVLTSNIAKEKNLPTNNTNEVELISFKLCDKNGNEIISIKSGDNIKIIYELRTNRDLIDPHYGCNIRNNFGLSIFQTNTYCMGVRTKPFLKGQKIKITYEMELPLAPGSYAVTFGVANKGYGTGSFEEYILRYHDIRTFEVLAKDNSYIFSGIFNPNPIVTIE